jgi:hypothetical protein
MCHIGKDGKENKMRMHRSISRVITIYNWIDEPTKIVDD